MFQSIIGAMGLIIYVLVGIYIEFCLIQIFISMRKCKLKKHHKFKFRNTAKLASFRNNQQNFMLQFVKWVVIDVLRGKDFYKLFGITCFTGFYGQGKTLGAVTYALNIKKRYPDVKLYANFKMKGIEKQITTPDEIVQLGQVPGRKVLVFDEIQSTFASTSYSEFPIELLWSLTQCRKNALAVLACSPVYTRMSIQLRESTDTIVVCKNVFKLDRWFNYAFYHAADYEKYQDERMKLLANRKYSINRVSTDKDYRAYDTSGIVDRMEVKEEKVKVKTGERLKNEILKLVDEKISRVRKEIA